MTKILAHRIQTLRLRRDAPWPLECASMREMIVRWRSEQRTESVKYQPAGLATMRVSEAQNGPFISHGGSR